MDQILFWKHVFYGGTIFLFIVKTLITASIKTPFWFSSICTISTHNIYSAKHWLNCCRHTCIVLPIPRVNPFSLCMASGHRSLLLLLFVLWGGKGNCKLLGFFMVQYIKSNIAALRHGATSVFNCLLALTQHLFHPKQGVDAVARDVYRWNLKN